MKTIKRTYIKSTSGYVCGFNREHSIVIVSDQQADGLPFETVGQAKKFVSRYAGAGFGLSAEGIVYETLTFTRKNK